MNVEPKEKISYIPEFIVVLGYILFLVLFVILCAFLVYFRSPQNSSQLNDFATSLPPITPSPSIPLTYVPEATHIFQDMFDRNQNSWTDEQDPSMYRFRDGKLVIESNDDGNYVLASCSKCPYLEEPYYLQADLSTDKLIDEAFGVVFKLLYSHENFYLFEINPAAQKYFLYHRTKDNWSLRMSGKTQRIASYPAVNRIGIYINKGTIEFYINEKIVDTYEDNGTSFQSGGFGFYANDAGFKLIIDNLTVDKAGGQ